MSPGTTGKVDYVVESLTRNPARVPMKLYIDGRLKQEVAPSFGPRGRYVGRLEGVTFNSVGTHTLRVAVDPSNTLTKKHSCANKYSRTVTVEVR